MAQLQVILLERVENLGQMGDVVKVKLGYARNFLLPHKKALRATKDNVSYFESRRAHLEADNLKRKSEAEAVAGKMDKARVSVVRQAGESGQLYGSVSTRDVADAVSEGGFTIDRRQVVLDKPIKTLGVHETTIALHPEVSVTVKLNIARSADEAERQARGEDVTVVKDEQIELETFNPDGVFDEDTQPEGEQGGEAEAAAEGDADKA